MSQTPGINFSDEFQLAPVKTLEVPSADSFTSGSDYSDMESLAPTPVMTGRMSKQETRTIGRGIVRGTVRGGRGNRSQVMSKRVPVKKNLSTKPVLPNIKDAKEDVNSVHRVLTGQLDGLPPMRSSVVRIFLSSTFSDYKSERNLLAKEVYPRLRDRCAAIDLDFQVVDLRWGVTQEASNDHLVEDLCFNEIEQCKRLSRGPFFVGMLGNRYGFHPLPREIHQTELEILKSVAEDEDTEGWQLLDSWYKLDENAVPPVYVLQPISSRLSHMFEFDPGNESAHKENVAQWDRESRRMVAVLHKSVYTAIQETHLDNLSKFKYIQSVTHQEFQHGLLQLDKESAEKHGVVFVRNFQGLYNELSSCSVQRHGCQLTPEILCDAMVLFTFSGIRKNEATGKMEIDYECEDLLEGLKKHTKDQLPNQSFFEYNLNWSEGGIQPDLDESHARYLQRFMIDFENTIWRMIENYKKSEEKQIARHFVTYREAQIPKRVMKPKESTTGMNSGDFMVGYMSLQNTIQDHKEAELKGDEAKPIDKHMLNMNYEVLHHLNFCKEKCRLFCGRVEELSSIKNTILSDDGKRKPVVIVAPSGCGKTAFMAKLAESCRAWLGKETVVMIRFLGTSPASSSIRKVLTSICVQITGAYALPLIKDNLSKLSKIVKYFNELMMIVSYQNMITKQLVIILDSIDQLDATDGAHLMQWLPRALPTGVHLLLSMLPEVHNCFENAKNHLMDDQCFVLLPELTADVTKEYIHAYLDNHKRTLTNEQKELLVKTFESNRQPLLMSLIMNEAKNWRSFSPVSEIALAETASAAIIGLLEKIERRFGNLFICAALGYLSISKGGLSEVELEDVLSCNDEVLDDVYQFHDPPVEGIVRIPPLMWTRVRAELSSYIVERQSNKHTVIYWYHRQFVEAGLERYSSGDQATKLHSDLAELFSRESGVCRGIYLSKRKKTIEDADRQITPHILHSRNSRKLTMLPYHLFQSGDLDLLKRETFCKFKFLLCFIEAFSFQELLFSLKEMLSEKEDPDLRLLHDSLHFSQGQIKNTISSLGGQILGQLQQHAENRPIIRDLCQQAQEAMEKSRNPVLIPIAGSIPSSSSTLKWYTTGLKQIHTLSPDGSILAAKSEPDNPKETSLTMIKMNTLSRGRNITIPKKDEVIKTVITKDNQRLYTLTKEEVNIFHVNSGECIQKIGVNINHAGLLNMAMAVSSNNEYLVLAGADRLGMLEDNSQGADEAGYKVRRAMNFNGSIKTTNLIFSLEDNLTISTHTIKGTKMVLGAAVLWDFWEKQLKTRVALPTTVEPGFLHRMAPLGGHNLVVCGCQDGQIFIVDMDIGKIIVQMGAQELYPSSILSHSDPSQNILLTAGKGLQTINVWKTEVDNHGIVATIDTPVPVSCITYSAETNHIIAGFEKGSIAFYELQGPSEVTEVARHQCHHGTVTSLVCDDKEQLISCGEDCVLKLWDIDGVIQKDEDKPSEQDSTGKESLLDGDLSVHHLESASRDKLITASASGLKVWKSSSISVELDTKFDSEETHLATLSEDGARILGIHGAQRELKLWNCKSKSEETLDGFVGVTIHYAMWSPDSPSKAFIAATKSNFSMLVQFDSEMKQATSNFPLGERFNIEICHTLKNGTILVCLLADSATDKETGFKTFKAMAIDLQNGGWQICMYHETKSINTEPYEKPVFCMEKLDDETVLLGCHNNVMSWQPPEKECFLSQKESMRTWLRHTRRAYYKLTEPGADFGQVPLTALTVSRDRKAIVSGDERGSVIFWLNVPKTESPTADHGVLLSAHSAAVSSMVLSADASILISGSLDRSIRVWSVPGGNHLCSIYVHMVVRQLTIDPFANYIVAKCQFAETQRVLALKLSACEQDSLS
ncbi:hypothetical protein CAPTEDRAFT_227456 [Capitella teleta]|uniref:NACHT domain-containing protein n=1 Tax=Capitella teleta TaxID=283909 RepID=R7V053_CAPTE|nr:hypothetical protein CAPTEDRAFT_227456 [Capitella teleta]|eukprot:ELU09567.1 hypothetical protein CAPTEDRAFT_227456 [Capitella teleta]